MKFILILIALCLATGAYAADTVLVDRDGVTTPVDAGSLSGVATAAQGVKADKITADEVYATDYNGGALNSATLNAALTAIGITAKTLVVTAGTWAFDANVTFPANVKLRVNPGAKFVWSSGYFTVNGPIDFPRQTVFQSFPTYKIVWGSKVDKIYIDWCSAVADGSTDDYAEIKGLIQRAPAKTEIIFSPKNYYIGTQMLMDNYLDIKVDLNGANIIAPNGFLQVGYWLNNYTGQTVSVTAYVPTFTIPGGVTLAVGDLVNLVASTPYLASGPSSLSYSRGWIGTVVDITGSIAKLDTVPLYGFTAGQVIRMTNGIAEIWGGTLDLSSATAGTTAGVAVTGSNIKVHDMRIKGSSLAGFGLNLIGNNIEAFNNRISDFLCLNGVSGGRYGDGIAAIGNNINIHDNFLWGSKHNLTFAASGATSTNVSVWNNTMWQYPDHYGATSPVGDMYWGASFDVHGNGDNINVYGNTIISSGFGVVNVRNSRGNYHHNDLRLLSTAGTGVFLASYDEVLADLKVSGNDLKSAVSVPLVDMDSTNVQFSNNTYSNVTWKGCSLKGANLYAAAAPTSYAWTQNDVVYNSAQTAGSVYGWRCVSSGTPGTWESMPRPAATTSVTLQTNSVNNSSQSTLNLKAGTNMTLTPDGAGGVTFDATSGSTGAPSAATYIVQTATNQPTNAQILASLASGLLYNTTATGVLSVKTIGTGANNIVALDANSKLPAVDGSALTMLGVGTTDTNTNIGRYSLLNINAGVAQNTAFGRSVLNALTTGSANTMIGAYTGTLLTTGSNNVAVGANSQTVNRTGLSNISIGNSSLNAFNPSDSRGGNIVIGDSSGQAITGAAGGSNNTFIGTSAGSTGSGSSLLKAIAIGYNAQVTADNSAVIGGTGSDAVKVGIGVTAPAANLDIQDVSGSAGQINLWSNAGTTFSIRGFSSSATVRPVVSGNRGRGTIASPAAVQSGDKLGTFSFGGYDSATTPAPQQGAAIDFFANGTISSGNVPAEISFATGTNSSTRTERLRITSGGMMTEGLGDYTASFTVANSTSSIALASGTATVTLPKTLGAGSTSVTVKVSGAAASGVTFAAESGGSLSWGDAGTPTFANNKRTRAVCVSDNTSATTSAAWDCIAGGAF